MPRKNHNPCMFPSMFGPRKIAVCLGLLLAVACLIGTETNPLLAQADGDAPIVLNFEDASLAEFIPQVRDILGINCIIDPLVVGKVNIRTDPAKPILKKDLMAVFEVILRMNNAAIIKQGSHYHILPISSGIKAPIGVYDYSEFVKEPGPDKSDSDKPDTDKPGSGSQPVKPAPGNAAKPGTAPPAGTTKAAPQTKTPFSATASSAGSAPVPVNLPVPQLPSVKGADASASRELATHIIPLEFVPVADLVQIIGPFLSAGGNIVTYAKANLLIITDFRDNVQRIRQIINSLDGRVFDRTFVQLVKIKYYSVKEVAEDLAKVVASGAKDLNSGINIIPVERLNSVFIVANSSRAMEKIQSWIDRLDSPQGRSQQIFVYPVQNSTANNIASILSQLYSEGGGSGSSTTGSRQNQGRQSTLGGGGAGSRTSGGLSGGNSAFGGGGSGGLGSNIQLQGGQQLGPQLSGSLNIESGMISGSSGNMRIVVDDLNNSLVIYATQPDYEYLLQTVKLLDVLPRQVLIEAKIFMVTLTNELSMGVQWYFEKLGGVTTTDDDTTTSVRTRRTTDASIGASKAGQFMGSTVFQVLNAKQIAAGLTALRTKTNLKVLEAPSILALDGQQAKIEVGDEVPISTSTYSSALNVVNTNSYYNQIQYRPTGVILAVSPRITASGMVTMEIAQEVSQVTGGSDLTPKINKSSVQTSLIVRDGDGVVIAGVMRDSLSSTRATIPILGDIPILGRLFGSSARTTNRTEIVVIIEPRVIKDPTAHQEATLDLEGRYKDLRSLIRNKQRTFEKNRIEAEEIREKDAERDAKRDAERLKDAEEKEAKKKAEAEEEARKAAEKIRQEKEREEKLLREQQEKETKQKQEELKKNQKAEPKKADATVETPAGPATENAEKPAGQNAPSSIRALFHTASTTLPKKTETGAAQLEKTLSTTTTTVGKTLAAPTTTTTIPAPPKATPKP